MSGIHGRQVSWIANIFDNKKEYDMQKKHNLANSVTSSTRLTYLGHAGFLFEYGGCSVLMDPFFHGACLGAVFPFPDNLFLKDNLLGKCFDYLYVSHTHQDHFDVKFLACLPKNTPVLCADFESRELERQFSALGFSNLIMLKHQQPQILKNDVRVTLLTEGTGAEDSALLVEAGGFKFLHLNDCQPRIEDLPEADVLTCQFSGAIHFPQTYGMYDETTKRNLTLHAIDTYYGLLERKIKKIKPRYFIPSAGPWCFLHPDLTKFNPGDSTEPTVFMDWEKFAGRAQSFLPASSVLRAYPNDVIDVNDDRSCMLRERFSLTNPYKNDTLERYAERRADELAPYLVDKSPIVTTEEMRAHWTKIQRTNQEILLFKGFSKKFTIEGYERSGEFLKRWYVHIGTGGPSVSEELPPEFVSSYTFKMPMFLLKMAVEEKATWDDLLSSHFINLTRDPDVFDPQFFALLRYHYSPGRSKSFVSSRFADEMIPLTGSPGTKIQRYCPHAGEDLVSVAVCDGVLVCPRHKWSWDVATGACLKGGNLSIRVEHTSTELCTAT